VSGSSARDASTDKWDGLALCNGAELVEGLVNAATCASKFRDAGAAASVGAAATNEFARAGADADENEMEGDVPLEDVESCSEHATAPGRANAARRLAKQVRLVVRP
jgi:hypothetical protein